MAEKETLSGHYNWHWEDVPGDPVQNDALRALRGMNANEYSNITPEQLIRWRDGLGNLLIEYRKMKRNGK